MTGRDEDGTRSAEIVRFPGGASGGGGGDINLTLAGKARNDLGNAERFIARHGQDILWVHEIGPHYWNDTHWNPEGAERIIKRKADATAESILEEVAALQKRGLPNDVAKGDWEKTLAGLMKWSTTSGNHARLNAMVKLAAPYLSVGPETMDADPLLLNLANGTLRLEGSCQDLRPHRREDHLTKIMDVEFDPDAACPAFLKFLEEVQPDPSIRRFLQTWAGYYLTGKTIEQTLVFNYEISS